MRANHSISFSFLLFLSLLATAQVADSAPNRVLRLDGDGDYVQLPSHIFDDLEQATIEAWVKWESFGWYEQWFGYGSGAKKQLLGINQALGTAELRFFIFDRDQEGHRLGVNTDLKAGRWVHMAAVSGPGGMRLYLNGVETVRNDFTGSFAAVDGDEVSLGRSNWRRTEPTRVHEWSNLDFMGDLDEVRVWRTQRSGAQIRAAMHRRLRGDEEGLAALWNFDGICAEGATVRDQSGNGHHGRLVGEAHCHQVELPVRLEGPHLLQGRALDGRGDPLSFILVSLAKDRKWLSRGASDQSGRFRFWAFGAGPYDLMAVTNELGTWRAGIDLTPGKTDSVHLTLRPAIGLQGRVVHLNGTPQHGVITQALAFDGRVAQTVQTDVGGHFRFINLQPGTYTVRFHLPDRFAYATASGHTFDAVAADPFHVEGGRTTTIKTVRLAPFRQGTWRVYGAFDGLKANAITGIASTADGTLWLATKGSGVWTFDGQTFTNLNTADGLVHDEVNDVTVTTDGAVWLATQGGATRCKDGRMTSLTTTDGLAHDMVNTIYEANDGALFFATHSGVSRWVGDRFEPIAQIDSVLSHTDIIDMYQDRAGALWLAGNWLGLWRYADGQMQYFNMRHGLGWPIIWDMLETRNGTMWCATQVGIARLDGGIRHSGFADPRFADTGVPFTTFHVDYSILSSIFSDIYQSRDGALWFATPGSGVLRSDGADAPHFVNFTMRQGLAHNSVGAIHEDFGACGT